VTSELASPGGLPCSILFIDASAMTARFSQTVSADTFGRTCELIRGGLRGADLLFTYDEGRFVALLIQTDASTADAVMRRVASEMVRVNLIEDNKIGSAALRIGRSSAPEDGASLAQLIKIAETRSQSPSHLTRPSVH
jgi:GGDEF domain-containing protein